MEGQLMDWVIRLVIGAVGGNAAGALMKDKSLGMLGNTISGVLGGGAGAAILGALGTGGGLIGDIAGAGVGGGLLMVVISLIKGAMSKK